MLVTRCWAVAVGATEEIHHAENREAGDRLFAVPGTEFRFGLVFCPVHVLDGFGQRKLDRVFGYTTEHVRVNVTAVVFLRRVAGVRRAVNRERCYVIRIRRSWSSGANDSKTTEQKANHRFDDVSIRTGTHETVGLNENAAANNTETETITFSYRRFNN